MYIATKTVTGAFSLTEDDQLARSTEEARGAKKVRIDATKGRPFETDGVPQSIVQSLIERGVLAKEEDIEKETVADISGDPSVEQGTEVEAAPAREVSKNAKGGK